MASRQPGHAGASLDASQASDKRWVTNARQLHDSGEPVAEMARVLKVSRATVYRHQEASRSGRNTE